MVSSNAAATSASPAPATHGDVDAELVYATTKDQSPYYYMYEPPPGTPRLGGEFGPRRVRVQDGRRAAGPFSLDVQGFELAGFSTRLENAYDEAEVHAVYYPEMERLVREATGAARVLVFDHNVRSGVPGQAPRRNVAEPVRRVHNDYTVESALRRLEQLLPEEASELKRRRFAFINVWRPLFGPVQDTPLAMCDARSIEPADWVKIELLYPDRVGENYNFTHSDRHRWYYFSEMRADEVLFLKCYDSARDGRASFTAHTAFDDPRTPAEARPRESIESRTIAFFAS